MSELFVFEKKHLYTRAQFGNIKYTLTHSVCVGGVGDRQMGKLPTNDWAE